MSTSLKRIYFSIVFADMRNSYSKLMFKSEIQLIYDVKKILISDLLYMTTIDILCDLNE